MNVTKLIERVPDSVKADICGIEFGQVMYNGERIYCFRVTVDRLLTDDEKTEMKRKRSIFGTDRKYHRAYAPEIKKSLFYIKC